MEISSNNLDDILYLQSVLNHIPTDRVIGKLYISSRTALNNHQKFSIDHLITLFKFDTKIKTIKHDIYDVKDSLNSEDVAEFSGHLDSISRSIHKSLMEGKNVCVHCHAGISRSATVVADYLLEYHNTGESTLQYIKKFRPIINPNPAFVELLNHRHNVKLDW